MDLRRSDTLLRFWDENGVLVELKKCHPLDFPKAQALPDLRHALSRFYTLKSEGCQHPAWDVTK